MLSGDQGGAGKRLLLVCFFFKGLHAVGGQHVKYKFTYHTETVSWNTASQVCRDNGGSLVIPDSQIKKDAIQYFKTRWQADGVLRGDYWIGLYDNNVTFQEYTWADCSSVDGATVNWLPSSGEPDNPDREFCVRNTQDDGFWRTKECDHQYQFICEANAGPCTFSTRNDWEISPSTADYTSVALPGTFTSLRACLAECTVGADVDSVCWAVTWTGSGSCTTHTAQSPVPIIEGFQHRGGYTTALRTCFVADSDVSAAESTQENADPLPVGCQVPVTTTSTLSVSSTEEQTTTSSAAATSITTTEPFTVTLSTSSEAATRTSDLVDSTGSSTSTTQQASGITATSAFSQGAAVRETTKSELTSPSSNIERTTAEADGSCVCPCPTPLTEEQSQRFIAEILQSLELDRQNVSLWRRRYVSVADDRPVAQGLGYSGAVILTVVFGGLVLLDSARLVLDLRLLTSRIRQIFTFTNSKTAFNC